MEPTMSSANTTINKTKEASKYCGAYIVFCKYNNQQQQEGDIQLSWSLQCLLQTQQSTTKRRQSHIFCKNNNQQQEGGIHICCGAYNVFCNHNNQQQEGGIHILWSLQCLLQAQQSTRQKRHPHIVEPT
eukprot:15360630-Ditylum_brightwellii.AAC.1